MECNTCEKGYCNMSDSTSSIICYESELTELFLNELKSRYNISDYKRLYKYLILRYLISKLDKIKKLKYEDIDISNNFEFRMRIIDFILYELDIITNERYIYYKDEKINKYTFDENSMVNIIHNIEYICLEDISKKDFFKEIELDFSKVKNSAKRKSFSKKTSCFYNKYIMYYALKNLNQLYGVSNINESCISNYFSFVQTSISILLEDKLLRYLNTDDYHLNDSIKISEDVLEKYIYENLSIIEEGLVPIKRQFSIKDARIDILAKDKNGVYTIIELKIEDDEDLIFQCIYYPKQFKKENNVSKVRIIVLSTQYSYKILSSLKELSSDIDIYKCKFKVSNLNNNKITKFNIEKV